ncbi:hypothetical protein QTP70_031333, partial [Hemibagrus guttatus]
MRGSKTFIFPSIFYICLPYYWVTGNLEPIPGDYRHKRGRLHPGQDASLLQGPITRYGQFRDANQPTVHVFGLGRKPEYPVETPEAWGEHAKIHTHIVEAGIEPPTLQ